MMKVMLAAIEIFSLVYQRIFAQKVLTQRKHSRVWECFVWGMYFVISNFLLTVLQKVRGTIQEYLLSHFFCFTYFIYRFCMGFIGSYCFYGN